MNYSWRKIDQNTNFTSLHLWRYFYLFCFYRKKKKEKKKKADKLFVNYWKVTFISDACQETNIYIICCSVSWTNVQSVAVMFINAQCNLSLNFLLTEVNWSLKTAFNHFWQLFFVCFFETQVIQNVKLKSTSNVFHCIFCITATLKRRLLMWMHSVSTWDMSLTWL